MGHFPNLEGRHTTLTQIHSERAFLDCTALRRLVKLPGGHKWRRVFAEENASPTCPEMRWPPWLHIIPDTESVSGLASISSGCESWLRSSQITYMHSAKRVGN